MQMAVPKFNVTSGGIFENGVLTLKRNGCSPSSGLRRRNLKREQSQVMLDLFLRKTRPGKSHNYCVVILFEKLRFQNVSVHTAKQSFSKISVFVTD